AIRVIDEHGDALRTELDRIEVTLRIVGTALARTIGARGSADAIAFVRVFKARCPAVCVEDSGGAAERVVGKPGAFAIRAGDRLGSSGRIEDDRERGAGCVDRLRPTRLRFEARDRDRTRRIGPTLLMRRVVVLETLLGAIAPAPSDDSSRFVVRKPD